MRFPLLACLFALLLAGCAPTAPPRAAGGGASSADSPVDPSPSDAPTGAEVILNGVAITGEWVAVGALDEPDADRDLRSGMLVRRLAIERGGTAMLSGEDRRAGTEPEYYEGRVTGNVLAFDDLPGEATLDIRSDGRLVFTDPRGRRTIYERG